MIYSSSFSYHGFLVKEDCPGELFGFGWNGFFQLGVGDKEKREGLALISLKKPIRKICCGYVHTFFLIENGELYSSGDNIFGQMGKDTEWGCKARKYPTLTSLGLDVLDIYVGSFHTIVLSKSFDVYSFGKKGEGQLGLGDQKPDSESRLVGDSGTGKINLPEKIIDVSCGGWFSIFISINGNVYVCGENNYNQLGIKSVLGMSSIVRLPKKITFFKKKKILQIACGRNHAVFLSSDNQVFVTGQNSHGELGLGDKTKGKNPRKVSLLQNEKIVSIKCGGNNTLFRSKTKMWVTGYNKFGQINKPFSSENFGENVFSPTLFTIKGKDIVQCLMMHATVIHITKEEVFGNGRNDVGELFCGSRTEKLRVKRCFYSKNSEEILQRFDFLLENSREEGINNNFEFTV